MSNQCLALPASTASTDASGSGITSALPGRARTPGSERRSSVSIAGSGSTAMTSAPKRDQRGGELAGSGAEVKHPRARRGLKRPAHRGLRVVGAVFGVCGGRCAERRTVK
ncbi:hypothetical protein [Streptomyces sp. NPDC000133]|uniref:hypothetical protein n=1 Tax=Streptomyces sp. NPDC000133 TaxID=3364535 RepID=UPI0036961509